MINPSTKQFMDKVLSETIGLSPGMAGTISPIQSHSVNIVTKEINDAADAIRLIIASAKQIDPESIDITKVSTLKNIAMTLQELT